MQTYHETNERSVPKSKEKFPPIVGKVKLYKVCTHGIAKDYKQEGKCKL